MPLEAAYVEHVTTGLRSTSGRSRRCSRGSARESESSEFVRRCAILGKQERVAFLHELGYE
jgi:hypothetical protein